jgi:hypothetical protein
MSDPATDVRELAEELDLFCETHPGSHKSRPLMKRAAEALRSLPVASAGSLDSALAELRKLSDAAEPGPWAWVNLGDKGGNAWMIGTFYNLDEQASDKNATAPLLTGCVEMERYDEDAEKFVQIAEYDKIIADAGTAHDDNPNTADAKFIVAVVNYVRAKLAGHPNIEPIPNRDALTTRLVEVARFEHDCVGATSCGTCEDIRDYYERVTK